MTKPPKSLIINSPHARPSQHWRFVEEGQPLTLEKGRRKAGYMVADPANAKSPHDKGIFVELPIVNQIRRRVDDWREKGYPGITGITRKLLDHWQDHEQREFPFFFCQIEAIETLIWLLESPDAKNTDLNIPTDGGEFPRLCCKLATGTGKTVVMAMLIAWQAINRATYPKDERFARHFLVIAPNLTVRERLAVLNPADSRNYYEEFGIAPTSLQEKLRQGKILVRNWHALNWESEEKIRSKKSVDKRGAKSDEVYAREVLGDMASARDLIVINDEAHHAWRIPAGAKMKDFEKGELDWEEATKWIGGLDRIHETGNRKILQCFDFSATPFAPSGKRTSEEALFGWIVSDFGLNDAIESGLVKTPRVVVRDDALPDAKTYKSRLYHIYNDEEVKDDLNRKAEPHEALPDLVMNAYTLLGADWEKTKNNWHDRHERGTPPVMITVANITETAARIKHAFDNKHIVIDALCERDGILHIDSKVLKQVESDPDRKQKVPNREQANFLREQVNTVGQEGKPGERIQNVISVGMLSEGWDARTVTQIMGLRAFTSQLLCEQVIGRGLRRASYEINEDTGLFDAEYVNVFGVPFSFLPHENDGDETPPPPSQKITVQPLDENREFAIEWPNVVRIDRVYRTELSVEWDKVEPLRLDASQTIQLAEIAPTVNGKPDVSAIEDIDLEKLMSEFRQQTIIFRTAQSVWQDMKPNWNASPNVLMAELVRLAEQFLASGRIEISPDSYNRDRRKRQLVLTLDMTKVIRHFWRAIEFNNIEKKTIVLDSDHPIRSTEEMRPWRTGKPCEYTKRSHINYCVYDSTWEASDAYQLDRHAAVSAWVKNDHLGFSILYIHNGIVRKYRPDFLVRLKSGDFLVLETKGQQTEQDDTKHAYMKEWVSAVNEHGGFGKWRFAVSRNPAAIKDILHWETGGAV